MKRRAKNLKSILCGFSVSCLMLAGSVSAQGMLDGSFTGNFPPKDWSLANAIGCRLPGVVARMAGTILHCTLRMQVR